ncbi:MAG: hypothetical protein IPJ61_19850 [Tessaracoccus sp.]|uniref:hypothetical protein n=1 Tax=Tessaracoccus sp. TaxID=1971211 RepID=UPI001ECC3641|nr:hypothetical protein [Tessaracoccus sp.]MBK7823241.1 hypothetical protein [Tessaracoccus sp.]
MPWAAIIICVGGSYILARIIVDVLEIRAVFRTLAPGEEADVVLFGRVCVVARTDDGGWHFSIGTNPDEDED